MKKIMSLLFALACVSIARASESDYQPSESADAPVAIRPAITSSTKLEKLYNEGKDAAYAGDYVKAEKLLSDAAREEPKNPDILNMLAYSQRKQDKLESALSNYRRALQLRPMFPEAREYLGEAYIQAALREIEILRSYGDSSKPQLKELIAALKDAAEEVSSKQ